MDEKHAQIVALLKNLHLFEGLDEAQLDQVAAVGVLVSLDETQELPLPEDRDVPFYVVAEGKISQLWPRGQGEQELLLKQGDFFGADVLFLGSQRDYRIRARSATQLIAIEAEQFAPLVKALPVLQKNLRNVLYIYSLVRNKHFDWVGEDEMIYLIARKHIDYLAVLMLPPIGLALLGGLIFLFSLLIDISSFRLVVGWLGGAALVAAALWMLWQYIDWSNDYYIVTDQRVVWLERVLGLYDSRQEAALISVKSEQTKSTFLGRILGYGDVVTQAFMGEVVFRHIGEPIVVRDLIDALRRKASSQQVNEDTNAMERVIRQKIDPPPPAPQAAPSPPAAKPSAPPRFLRWFGKASAGKSLVDYFKTRVEEDGVITYRKHGFYLLTKVALPTLTCLAIIALSGWFLWRSTTGQIAFPTPLTVILLGMFLLVPPVLWWLYQFVDWRNDIYRITSDQIIDSERKPLGDELTKSAPLENILSLDYERVGIIGILLNYGSVIINVGTESKLTWDNIHDPARAQRDIFHAMYSYRRKKQLSDAAQEWDRVSDWLAAYHRQAEDLRHSQNSAQFDQNPG
ncbi:MAG: cyclic nucleotide-binding domain-containing protein [Anaerolineales bacterium]|nr:cyclic nucleotide-binding domain-containing protein [Anaerolineales bacterium]